MQVARLRVLPILAEPSRGPLREVLERDHSSMAEERQPSSRVAFRVAHRPQPPWRISDLKHFSLIEILEVLWQLKR
jgi:hypothetical protein